MKKEPKKKGRPQTKATRKKISEALIGNKNPEKWTLEESKKLFKTAFDKVKDTEEIVLAGGIVKEAYKYDFIGELARDCDVYHSLFRNLADKFPKDLKQVHSQLLEQIESNCFYNTKKGNIKEAIGIVNLKSNYKWTDRLQTENETKVKFDGDPFEQIRLNNEIKK